MHALSRQSGCTPLHHQQQQTTTIKRQDENLNDLHCRTPMIAVAITQQRIATAK
jgi:hypothetical protein